MLPLRVYPYKYPVISFKVPRDWVLRTRLQVEGDAEEGKFVDWKVAEKIGRRAFQAYFGATPSEHRDWDFELSLNSVTVGFKVHTKLISDYNPLIGDSMTQKLFKHKTPITVYHVLQTWFLPRITILGFIDSKVAPAGSISPINLEPVYKNPYLHFSDKKKAYV